MQEYFRLNGKEVGFANHPTEGAHYLPKALDTEAAIWLGKIHFNLHTPALDLAEYLSPEAPDFYRDRVPYVQLRTYLPNAVPGGAWGGVLKYPTNKVQTDLWVSGLPGSEKFHGTVTVHEGYLLVSGELKTYEGALLFNVEARKTFAPRPLLPPRKRYKRQEALEQPPLEVYELAVGQGEYATFPEEVLAYKNLEYLWLGGQARLNFTELPEAFFELTKLRSLLVYNHKLRQLPATLEKLRLLEELTFDHGPLTKLPAEMGNLSHLRRVDFRYNALTDLPASVAALPELRRMDLSGNAFTRLPGGLVRVPSLKLDRKFRKLYTDDRYLSTNPEPVDHSLFNLDRYPAAKKALGEAITANPDLRPGRELLQRYARMATYLVPGEANVDIPLGASKLGGAPDLPVGTEHPSGKSGKLLVFHAQLNCAELAPFQDYLPRTGMLYFYVSDEEMIDSTRVIYEADTERLYRVTYNGETEFTDADMDGYWRKSVAVTPKNAVSLPDLYNAGNHGAERFPTVAHLFADAETTPGALTDEQMEALDEAVRALTENNAEVPRQKLPFTAREVHSINGYVFTQHESPEEQAAARFGGEPQDYLTLLNLESLGEFSFWDAGTLTYCVHKQDLAIGVFERVGAFIESS